jgi:HlyD family secretion protein
MASMNSVPEGPRRRHVYLVVALAAVGVVALTVSVRSLESRVPSVARSTLWIDSVRRGTMLQQVHAPGTLVAERELLISALTAGRVDSLDIRTGSSVTATTPLLTLTNPDVQLRWLDAQRQVGAAKASFVSLQTALEQQRLSQSEAVAQAETDSSDAVRNATVLEALDRKGMAGANELQRSRDLARAAKTRLSVERERSRVLAASIDQQLALEQSQIDQLSAIADFQARMVESLHVTAGERGVIEAVPVQLGQWVTPGTVLARVARPGKVKAVLRVPDAQAKDVALGQLVSLSTPTGTMAGRVAAIDPSVQNGIVDVDVALDGALSRTARPEQSVDGTIEIEHLADVLYIHRPPEAQAGSTITLFKLDPDGHTAVRTAVTLGRSAPASIEVVHGLQQGDQVILSDMSNWGAVHTVRID